MKAPLYYMQPNDTFSNLMQEMDIRTINNPKHLSLSSTVDCVGGIKYSFLCFYDDFFSIQLIGDLTEIDPLETTN